MNSTQDIVPKITITPTKSSSEPTGRDFDQMLFPSENRPALLGYYFGCAGILPFIGLPFSILAIKFGHKGLKQNLEKPVPGAKAHAKVGIILGYFELTVFVLFIALMIYFYLTRPDKSMYKL